MRFLLFGKHNWDMDGFLTSSLRPLRTYPFGFKNSARNPSSRVQSNVYGDRRRGAGSQALTAQAVGNLPPLRMNGINELVSTLNGVIRTLGVRWGFATLIANVASTFSTPV